MKRLLLIIFAVLMLALVGMGIFVAVMKPKQQPASTEKIEATAVRLERGRYLVESALGCLDCHSKLDLTRYGAPVLGPRGAGGECLGEDHGFPGRVCMKNITSDPETGIGGWTDGEILRAIREGVDRQGRALFPMMPYTEYAALSDEDARAVVAYLRTLPPVKNPIPEADVDFPVSFFIKMAPRPLPGPVADPPAGDRVARGRYLAKVSGCQSCHTPVDKQHRPLAGFDFAGGQQFPGPWGMLRSSNLTPHATGLGGRSEQEFIGMFKAFNVPEADLPKVTPAQNTVMPWLSRARMTDEDLGAIYAFLRTVPAVDQTIEKRPPPASARPAAPPPAP